MGPNGLLLLNKSAGETSFDSLWRVKKTFHTRKAGHTGTLDKFATGLLVVLVGRALRLSPWFTGCDKRYEAQIRFGEETDTLDPEGRVIATAAPPDRQALEQALPRFSGDILQAPPEYSAIHIDGKRASALAREGRAPEMKKRQVSVHSLELAGYDPPFARINVHCSSGTYIRSLARDIALACGSRARLETLKRTAVAGFTLEEAAGADDDLAAALKPITADMFAKIGVPVFDVNARDVGAVRHGKPLGGVLAGDETAADSLALFHGGDFLAMAVRSPDSGAWKYGFVYARDAAPEAAL